MTQGRRKTTRILPISKKKHAKMRREKPIRIALCERAGGEWDGKAVKEAWDKLKEAP